jgi:hypothetical protein
MTMNETKLNLFEARDEFIELVKAFKHYNNRVKLGGSAGLFCFLGDDLLSSIWSDAAPGVDLLLAAANEMARDGDGPDEIKETFDIFIENVVMAKRSKHVPTPLVIGSSRRAAPRTGTAAAAHERKRASSASLRRMKLSHCI